MVRIIIFGRIIVKVLEDGVVCIGLGWEGYGDSVIREGV